MLKTPFIDFLFNAKTINFEASSIPFLIDTALCFWDRFIYFIPSEINWMNEDGQYTGWISESDFNVESLDDYDDFFEREEKYFYEQDIYT